MDDLISRQKVIDELVRWGKIPDYSEREKDVIGTVIGLLSTFPSAQLEQRTGRWMDLWDRYRCSVCNMEHVYEENFCPNCGADMRG